MTKPEQRADGGSVTSNVMLGGCLTKSQAVDLLHQGYVMTHALFTDDEWVRQTGLGYVFEDGILCTPEQFWSCRQGEAWETGWSVHMPPNAYWRESTPNNAQGPDS